MNKRYNTPPTGWTPAKDSDGYIHHWDGPMVLLSDEMILISTFRHRSGITVENLVDFTTFTLDELLGLADRLRHLDGEPIEDFANGLYAPPAYFADRLVEMHHEVERAEKEINR